MTPPIKQPPGTASRGRPRPPSWSLPFLIAMTLASIPVQADPGYYVVTAYDNEGQRTIDTRYWTVKFPNRPLTTWPEVGFGAGVTSRWYTELFASWIGSPDSATKLSTLNWQNEVLLTQGQWPVDVAVHASLVHDMGSDGGYAIEIGPVIQTDIGRTQLNANMFFERNFGEGQDRLTRMKYQWQIKHRWAPLFNPGFQGFGELGPWDHWLPADRQSHRAGPAFFGTLRLDDHQSVLYQAAYLVGSIYGRHGGMFSMRVQYAF